MLYLNEIRYGSLVDYSTVLYICWCNTIAPSLLFHPVFKGKDFRDFLSKDINKSSRCPRARNLNSSCSPYFLGTKEEKKFRRQSWSWEPGKGKIVYVCNRTRLIEQQIILLPPLKSTFKNLSHNQTLPQRKQDYFYRFNNDRWIR